LSKELSSPERPKLASSDEYKAIFTCLKEQMGYPKAKAEEAAKHVSEKFSSETLEDKIKHTPNYLCG
jgi:Holliday junction resolvasome RuvABC DNA-binding subunit